MARIDPQLLSASLRRLDALDIGGDDGVDVAMDRAVRACVDVFGVDGSGLMVADEQDTLRYVVSSDAQGRVMETVQTETGQGPCVEAFVTGVPVRSDDLATETRWPACRDTLVAHGVRAVLGIPVKAGAVTVGSLDVYRGRPHVWDDSERAALERYAGVVQAVLSAALTAHSATRLARQLQYALDNRVVIDRAIGFVMASSAVGAVEAFDVVRRAARGSRREVADVAREVLERRVVPGP